MAHKGHPPGSHAGQKHASERKAANLAARREDDARQAAELGITVLKLDSIRYAEVRVAVARCRFPIFSGSGHFQHPSANTEGRQVR